MKIGRYTYHPLWALFTLAAAVANVIGSAIDALRR